MKDATEEWKEASGITEGALFRSIHRTGRVWGTGMTPKVLWEIVREAASRAGIEKLAPHDLRRSCARLCRLAGGELDQIQFLLGHVSIQTTERYLGCNRSCAAPSMTGWGSNPPMSDHQSQGLGADRPPLGDKSGSVFHSAVSRSALRASRFLWSERLFRAIRNCDRPSGTWSLSILAETCGRGRSRRVPP